jgi:hypothetical protein
VIWVTGPYKESNDLKMVRNLRTAEQGIRAYLEGGGRIFLSGQSLVGTRGGFSDQFALDVLGIPGYYRWVQQDEASTRVTDLFLNRDSFVYFESDGRIDSLKVGSSARNTDFCQTPSSPGTGRYWVPPGAILEMNGIDREPEPSQEDDPAYIGAVSDYGDGKIGIVTTAFARLFERPPPGEPPTDESIQEAVSLLEEILSP